MGKANQQVKGTFIGRDVSYLRIRRWLCAIPTGGGVDHAGIMCCQNLRMTTTGKDLTSGQMAFGSDQSHGTTLAEGL